VEFVLVRDGVGEEQWDNDTDRLSSRLGVTSLPSLAILSSNKHHAKIFKKFKLKKKTSTFVS